MALLDSMGTGVRSGASVETESITLTNYILESATDGVRTYDFEDVMNEDGARVSRLIFNRQKQLVLTLILKTAADPITDFPVGDMCPYTGLTSYFVTSAPITKVKGAMKVTVTLDKIFTNA